MEAAPAAGPWTFRVVDRESGQPVELLSLNFARGPTLSRSGGVSYSASVTRPLERAPRGLIQTLANEGEWMFKVSAPGFASSYGAVLADGPDVRLQTVRLDRGASIRGVLALDGVEVAGLRVECELDLAHSASEPRQDMLSPFGGLERFFELDRYVALTDAGGAFVIRDLPAAAHIVTVTQAGRTVWETRGVVTSAGATTDLGVVR